MFTDLGAPITFVTARRTNEPCICRVCRKRQVRLIQLKYDGAYDNCRLAENGQHRLEMLTWRPRPVWPESRDVLEKPGNINLVIVLFVDPPVQVLFDASNRG